MSAHRLVRVGKGENENPSHANPHGCLFSSVWEGCKGFNTPYARETRTQTSLTGMRRMRRSGNDLCAFGFDFVLKPLHPHQEPESKHWCGFQREGLSEKPSPTLTRKTSHGQYQVHHPR